jgi:hypothetical protein
MWFDLDGWSKKLPPYDQLLGRLSEFHSACWGAENYKYLYENARQNKV